MNKSDKLEIDKVNQADTSLRSAAGTKGFQVRDPQLEFDESIPKHWCRGNPVSTHGFNAINFLFPAGERFFIKTLLVYKDKIDDPKLIKEIALFAGQENMHALYHERYFKLLETQGYEFQTLVNRFARYRRWTLSSGFSKFNVASTVAAEHYTASYAFAILSNPEVLDDVHPDMRRFIIWHACEEVEHRSVSFDVMQYAKVGYFTRILAYIVVTLDITIWLAYGSLILLKQDGYSLFQIWKLRRKVKKNSFVGRNIRRSIFSYFRPGFHPSQKKLNFDIESRLNDIGLPVHKEK